VEDEDAAKQDAGYRSWSIDTGTVIRKRTLKDAKRREQLKSRQPDTGTQRSIGDRRTVESLPS
jgi:hypothetical protein